MTTGRTPGPIGKRLAALVATLLMVSIPITFTSGAQATGLILLEEFTSGLSSPTFVTPAGDGTGRLFVTERTGTIKVRQPSGGISVFLDITSRVRGLPDSGAGSEEGLLSVAFHPSYETNGHFYVFYTDLNGNNVVARFTASPPSSNSANATTEQIVLTVSHPTFSNHNGGQLQFGPDGLLYIGTGDGGGGDDPGENAENINSLLGKILRIDINSGSPYSNPAGNPFIGVSGLDEIWAYGLRNPWRFSFDRATGEMFIGDVGQDRREEINFQPPGAGGRNYGWDMWEGTLCNEGSCSSSGRVFPIVEYATGGDCSVTGGYRYRGSQNPALQGTYLYGDFCSGKIWGASFSGGWSTSLLADTAQNISSFGEDEEGEIYVADLTSGKIFRLRGPGRLRGGPDSASWEPNRLDVFGVGSGSDLIHKYWAESSWSGWESLGGTLTSDPGTVSWGLNRLDVFGRGADSALWHKSWQAVSWSGWETLGGVLTSGPDVSSWGTDRLDIFARGADGGLWHILWNGSWSGWEGLGGALSSDPGVVSWSPNRIDIFVRGMDNALWHKYWSGTSWSGWEHLGGHLTSGPDVSSWGANRLDIFARGGDGALWHMHWNGSSWSGWESLGGFITSDPSAVSRSTNRIDIFARGGDEGLWHIEWNGGSWSGWGLVG